MDLTMKLLRLAILIGFYSVIQLAEAATNPVSQAVIAVPTVNRATVQALWEKDLYPYQLEGVRRGLEDISDADFPEFAKLVSGQLIPISQHDDANSIAGYNAEIIAHFAATPKNFRPMLEYAAAFLCANVDPDDKPEVIKNLSMVVQKLSVTDFKIFVQIVKTLSAVMNGFQKKQLVSNLSKLSVESINAFLNVVQVVSPVFFTDEHKSMLYNRLASMIDEKNKADFMAVAAIHADIFKAVEAHLRDGNRMINFIVDLINKNPQERQAFIAANFK